MERDQKVSTTVTSAEKQHIRVRAAKQGQNMSEYIRSLIYEDLQAAGYDVSRDRE